MALFTHGTTLRVNTVRSEPFSVGEVKLVLQLGDVVPTFKLTRRKSVLVFETATQGSVGFTFLCSSFGTYAVSVPNQLRMK